MEIRIKIDNPSVTKEQISFEIIEPPKVKTYVPFPAPPVFSNPNTIVMTGNHSIFASALNGKTQQILTGTPTNLTLNGIGGTPETPIVFKGPVTIKGTSTTQRCVRTLNATKHFELHQMRLEGNDGGVMLSAGTDSPSGVFLSDVIMMDHSFAGFWCNSAKGLYSKINSKFLRVFRSKGEMLYLGNTATGSRSIISQSHHEHLFGTSSGWDGLQFTSVDDLHVNKATVMNTGTLNVTGQDRQAQFQMCRGVVENSIFYGGMSSMEFFCHDFTFRNNFCKWDVDDNIYIGEKTGDPQLNGKPLVFDGDFFSFPGNKPVFKVAMRGADVIVKNCTISSNHTALFEDVRGTGAVNKLIDGGGNVFVDVEEPTFEKEPDGDAMIVTSDFHYYRGMGYRTP